MLFPHIYLVNYVFLPLLLIQQGKYENELLYTPTWHAWKFDSRDHLRKFCATLSSVMVSTRGIPDRLVYAWPWAGNTLWEGRAQLEEVGLRLCLGRLCLAQHPFFLLCFLSTSLQTALAYLLPGQSRTSRDGTILSSDTRHTVAQGGIRLAQFPGDDLRGHFYVLNLVIMVCTYQL